MFYSGNHTILVSYIIQQATCLTHLPPPSLPSSLPYSLPPSSLPSLLPPFLPSSSLPPPSLSSLPPSSLLLTQRQQLVIAQEMFKESPSLSREEKTLILGFMAGSRGTLLTAHHYIIVSLFKWLYQQNKT